MDAELLEFRAGLSEITTEELEVESVLDFAEELFLDPAKMWRQLSPEKKRVFQDSMFPEGVTFDGSLHRTQVAASFLAGLRDLQGGDTRMAPRASPVRTPEAGSPFSGCFGTGCGRQRDGVLGAGAKWRPFLHEYPTGSWRGVEDWIGELEQVRVELDQAA